MHSEDLPQPFGPYTLLRRLAAGGMAEVYLAKARGPGGFEKEVAVKRIHPHHADNERFASTLLEEAKLSASLCHRNIVQTLDLAEIEGAYVIVMERVEGYDANHVLAALRRSGRRFPVDLAAHVVGELFRGLDYAHEHRDATGELLGIVHRDVSPQNVLLSFAGEVKLGDFGIAKAKSRASEPEPGVIKGKYFYMSPEQAWAEPLDHRSDIFSTGLVLWELLVGERLHGSGPLPQLLDAVRRAEVPPPSSLRRDVPKALDRIVAKATAVDPADRYRDAGAAADALEVYLASRPPVYASRRLAEILADLPPPAAISQSGIPLTRDRVVTESAHDDGEPTLAGWRSPRPTKAPHRWLWALGAGSLLTVATAWLLHGT
jgi:serine/threonine protein kinase